MCCYIYMHTTTGHPAPRAVLSVRGPASAACGPYHSAGERGTQQCVSPGEREGAARCTGGHSPP